MPASKPNFVIFMLDQLAPQFMPAYGHKPRSDAGAVRLR
jgi:arylsulfatase A-like enzyme